MQNPAHTGRCSGVPTQCGLRWFAKPENLIWFIPAEEELSILGGLRRPGELIYPERPSVYGYDCSGPYTDPQAQIDIRQGLKPLNQA